MMLRNLWDSAQTSLECARRDVEFSSFRMTQILVRLLTRCVASIEPAVGRRFTPGLFCPYRFLDFCPAHRSNRRSRPCLRVPQVAVFI
jgi:hypothetical protein